VRNLSSSPLICAIRNDSLFFNLALGAFVGDGRTTDSADAGALATVPAIAGGRISAPERGVGIIVIELTPGAQVSVEVWPNLAQLALTPARARRHIEELIKIYNWNVMSEHYDVVRRLLARHDD
jgi:hypothetical protein